MDFDQAVKASFGNLFGGLSTQDAIKLVRELNKLLHPDVAPEGRKDEAQEAFVRVGALYQKFINPTATPDVTIHTREHIYKIDGLAATGAIGNLYLARMLDDDERLVLIKMPVSPKDNDLVEAEETAYKCFQHNKDFLTYSSLLPDCFDSFKHVDSSTGIKRHVIVLEPYVEFYTLNEIIRTHPNGLHPRAVAWIFRRILAGLGFAHKAGILHNSINPDNIIINPKTHSAKIVGWSHSTKIGSPMKSLDSNHMAFYPPEVTIDKAPHPGPETDLFMAAKVLLALGGSNLPRRLHLFGRACINTNISARPNDAWGLIKEFDNILFEMWGNPKYYQTILPADAKPALVQ